jgi:hypothetical protein
MKALGRAKLQRIKAKSSVSLTLEALAAKLDTEKDLVSIMARLDAVNCCRKRGWVLLCYCCSSAAALAHHHGMYWALAAAAYCLPIATFCHDPALAATFPSLTQNSVLLQFVDVTGEQLLHKCVMDSPSKAATAGAAPASVDDTPVTASSVTHAEAFSLSSKPGALKKILLDFDGHVTTNSKWNVQGQPTITSPAWDTDGDPTSFSDTELAQIKTIWSIVAEGEKHSGSAEPGLHSCQRAQCAL